ncbi:hypothetical protein F2P79_014947 [Pimephales promelas]|nr:hypothetical protein F2P79_014947 [Pimephales promelas]
MKRSRVTLQSTNADVEGLAASMEPAQPSSNPLPQTRLLPPLGQVNAKNPHRLPLGNPCQNLLRILN